MENDEKYEDMALIRASNDTKGTSEATSRGLLSDKMIIGWVFLCALVYWSTREYLRNEASGPRTDKIEWSVCGDGFECGRLLVPLDYKNESLGHANLSVGRLLARNRTARLGSLFVNPGGPGNSGLEFLYRAGSGLAELLDNRYDIVSWNPRGVNGTTPTVDCYASQTDQDIAFAHTSVDTGFEARNLSDPIDRAVYAQQVRKADAENAVIVELCLNRSGEALRYVGTDSVVRDLELLSRVIEGPEKPVNFWGFRYFINVFPHRVGKVILDGVVDPLLWSTVPAYQWGKWDLADAESAYTNFLEACASAGPERCALRLTQDTTSFTIRQRVEKLIHDLYERPLPVPAGEQPYIVTSGMVRELIFNSMYHPRKWPVLAEQLADVMRGDGRLALSAILNKIELDTRKKPWTDWAGNAVRCVDGPDISHLDPHQLIEDTIEENVFMYERTTRHFAARRVLMCHHWKVRNPERFVGPFNSTILANNILIIGNVVDPMTPLVNARVLNRMLPQSRLIIQNGTGHCSYAMASLCIGRAIRRYLLEGVSPPNGVVCDTNEQLFPEISRHAGDKTGSVHGTILLDQDAKLVSMLQNFGRAMDRSAHNTERGNTPSAAHKQ
ncbi:hypothetical protein FRC09_001837 [Ceratobasidium sp. 395]|nr:hypothetical protein FRC09_001837 [Ceratobasidium sp. 395]